MIMIENVPFSVLETNLQDATIQIWDAATTYAKLDIVQLGKYIYQSLSDDNTGFQPDITPLKWAIVGVQNTQAVWDKKYIYLKSEAPDRITFTIEAGFADFVTFGGLEANSVTVEQYKNGALFQTYTQRTVRWLGDTFREYVFVPYSVKTKANFFLTPLLRQQIRITIEKTGSVARCAYIVIGRKQEIGSTLPKGQLAVVDFSKKERTKEGVIYLKPGKVVDDGRYSIVIKNSIVDTVIEKIKSVRGTPTMFIPTCKESTGIYGFIKDFRMTLNNETSSEYQIEIEEI